MAPAAANMAQELARVVSAFEEQRTGHVPKAMTVVLSADTLVIALHEAIPPAERALARTPAGAAELQEFHRQLFATSAAALRQEIQRITGVAVCEESAAVDRTPGSVLVQAFPTGTVVQVFLLAGHVAAAVWTGSKPEDEAAQRGG
jgi:uncharacterized protein YbcI